MILRLVIVFIALETTVFTFKISVPFADWTKTFDSPGVEAIVTP